MTSRWRRGSPVVATLHDRPTSAIVNHPVHEQEELNYLTFEAKCSRTKPTKVFFAGLSAI